MKRGNVRPEIQGAKKPVSCTCTLKMPINLTHLPLLPKTFSTAFSRNTLVKEVTAAK